MADTWVSTDQNELGEYASTSSYIEYCHANPFVAPSSYTCNRLGIYSHADPQNDPYVKLALYADDGDPVGFPLAETDPIQVTGGSQWFDGDIDNVSITQGNTYYVAMVTAPAPTAQWRYRDTSPANGGSSYITPVTYPTFPESPDSGPSTNRYGAMRMGFITAIYTLVGVTKDKNGNALGVCECFLFKLAVGEDDATFIDYAQSDGSGNYSFTEIVDDDARYFVVAWKDNTPHVFDCTDHVLVPVEE